MMREQFSLKTAKPSAMPLPGSLHAEWVRCGKALCRCMNGGPPHGPYWRRFWRDGERTRKQYVPLAKLGVTQAACDRHQQLHLSRRAFHRMARAFSTLNDAAIAALESKESSR